MLKFQITYETYNPISGWRSERLTKVIEETSANNAIAALGQKIDNKHGIDIYSVEEKSGGES
jgi:hypothetical protein